MERVFNEVLANEIIAKFNSKIKNRKQVKTLYGILSEMCQWAINRKSGVLNDYFAEIKINYKLTKKSKQVSEQEDSKAYSYV